MINLKIDLNISEALFTNMLSKLHNNSSKIESYILDLLRKDLQSNIFLNNNFYFDYNQEKIYYENNEVILTRHEYDLFKLLLDNANTIVTFEMIESFPWKSRIPISRFGIRNYIRQLRLKIYPELIENKSNFGYIMILE